MKIRWNNLLPWLYTAICWILIGMAIKKEDWRYFFALAVVVIGFFFSLFTCGPKPAQNQTK